MGGSGITLHVSSSLDETARIAEQFATMLTPGNIICFYGDLGAGKTTFIKGVTKALTGLSETDCCSPTFGLCHRYEGNTPVYHFDLYRLNGVDEFLDCGFQDQLQEQAVFCIEWPERIEPILPKSVIRVTLEHVDEEKRSIKINHPI